MDDEKSIRMLLNYVLAESGYAVKEAENGVQMAFANLDGIDMRGCAMYGDGASMEGTSLIGADLRNAYFTNYEAYGGSDNITNFEGTVLRGAIYNEKSRFPFNGEEASKRGMILRPGEY